MKTENKVILQSYKHDQSLHRVWKTETILFENDEYIILANKKTRVVEANGRFWYTKEPSVSFLFKKHWYNVIGIIKNEDVNFYCNICSPILRDSEALKYIDYDLDIKVDPNFNFTLLDQNEFNRNQKLMNYPDDIKKILILEVNNLKERILHRDFPFQNNLVLDWYKKYINLSEKE